MHLDGSHQRSQTTKNQGNRREITVAPEKLIQCCLLKNTNQSVWVATEFENQKLKMKTMKTYKYLTLCAALFALALTPSAWANDDTNSVPNTDAMSGTNAATEVDNSQMNQRDRNNATRTPLEQGNSSDDIQTTQQLRKFVAQGTNNFSVMAQNIKIITRNGTVTLRGPVQTEDEKISIDSMAREVAGTNNVNDLLEVKNNP